MARRPVTELLGQPVARFSATPAQPTPAVFLQATDGNSAAAGAVGADRPGSRGAHGKVAARGAISITFRVPFQVARIEDRVLYHELRFSNGSLHNEAKELAEAVRRELVPSYIRPAATLADEEAYTFFA